MNRMLLTGVAVALCSGCFARSEGAVSEAMPASTDSLSVAVGISLGKYVKASVDHLATLGVEVNPDVVVATMGQMLNGLPTAMTEPQAEAWLDDYIRSTRPDDLPESFTIESQEEFLRQVAATDGAVTTPDGLVFIVLEEGEGPMPVDGQTVRLKYRGRFSDGTVFDATGSPIEFGVNQVTPGFSEGLKLMRPGGTYRIVMPASLGYGPEGIPGAIPGNAALDFTVELFEVK